MIKLIVLLLVVAVVGAIVVWIFTQRDSAQAPLEVDFDDPDTEVQMDPSVQGFVLETAGDASLSEGRLPLKGRLQTFVKAGEQYATWRQFPESIHYEIEVAPGKTKTAAEEPPSFSDTTDTYARYAAMPAEQIVGQTFMVDAFDALRGLIEGPGIHRLRAHYQAHVSNWIEVELGP